VKSKINNKPVFGMMNIGTRPTVEGKNQTIEVHFFDFDQDLYDKKITIEMIDFIREELKFESVESLKNQLHKDKQICKNYINNSKFNIVE
jgi:riboflavin kinase/FMN adenylyltransferase